MSKWIPTVLLCLLAAAVFCGCRKATSAPTIPMKPAPVETAPKQTAPKATNPTHPSTQATEAGDSRADHLIATVESREKAEELAELYGIELVSYAYQVAEFQTDEDPDAVIQRGIDNGWPRLDRNHPVYAF